MDGADGDKIRIKSQKLGVGSCKSMIVGGVDVLSGYDKNKLWRSDDHSLSLGCDSEASLRRKRMRVRGEKLFV